jgi:hypothetical protein
VGKRRTKTVAAKAPSPAWYVESTADGGAHHGVLKDRVVSANCGLTFLPLDYATRRGEVIRWHEPVDEAHACPACWKSVHGSTSFYEVANG